MSAGYALALNDTLATSLSVSALVAGAVDHPEDARLSLPGRFNARVGVTAWVARGLYVEPSVTVALSGPASGFVLGITFPYSF